MIIGSVSTSPLSVRNHAQSLAGKRLSESPWERDIRAALVLLGHSHYAAAHPVCRKLLKDNSEWVRYTAAIALGRIGKKIPAALKDLRSVMGDKKLGNMASQGLRIAEGPAVPMLVDAIGDQEWLVRNRAVYALPWIEFNAARPAYLAALRHQDAETRSWGVSVLINAQGRGYRSGNREIVGVLKEILADPDLAHAEKKSVEAALGNMVDPLVEDSRKITEKLSTQIDSFKLTLSFRNIPEEGNPMIICTVGEPPKVVEDSDVLLVRLTKTQALMILGHLAGDDMLHRGAVNSAKLLKLPDSPFCTLAVSTNPEESYFEHIPADAHQWHGIKRPPLADQLRALARVLPADAVEAIEKMLLRL